MSTIPTGAAPSEPKETFVYEAAPLPRWIYVALVVLVLLVGYLFYAGYTAQDKLQTSLTAATNQEAAVSYTHLDVYKRQAQRRRYHQYHRGENENGVRPCHDASFGEMVR